MNLVLYHSIIMLRKIRTLDDDKSLISILISGLKSNYTPDLDIFLSTVVNYPFIALIL